MSNKPEAVDYKPVIYLASKDNLDKIDKLFNNKLLQQEIKLVAEDISKENPFSSSKINRAVGRMGLALSSFGVGLLLGPTGVTIFSTVAAGILVNNIGGLLETKNNISDKNRKLSENNNINLLEQNFQIVPYSSVSGTLIFPPGHPMPNKVYRQHPLPDKKNYYMPNDYYYKILLEEKEAELMKILCDLGANKIEIHEEENSLNSTIFEAEAKVTSVAGTEAAISKEHENSQLNKREFSYIGKPWHSNLKDEFESSKYRWLHYEPTWESIVHGRLTNGQLMANIELTTTLSKEEMIGISLGITLEKVFLENLGLSTSVLDSNYITKKRIFHIEFPGKE
ncbi:MAG: hypothetical protein ACRCU2_27775 [Planktothrix sp.]